MEDPAFWHRLQFAFTVTYHYLFPQLTMGLALLVLVMKTLGLRPGGEPWTASARFWIRIFGINFALGVVTGIPMEFQFGTNWAAFSRFAGGVVGHTLGMEGLFAFFLESSFFALLVWGERRLGRRGHFLAALAEQEHAEEGRLGEEGEDAFHEERLPDDAAGVVREARPVGPELELHRDAGDDAGCKGDREDLRPEPGGGAVDIVERDHL